MSRLIARRFRSGSLSVAVTVMVLVVIVGLNVLAARGVQRWDLTRGGLNTLAPQSVLAAKRLPGDLQVIGLFRSGPGNGETDAEALVALYQAQSSHILYTREDFDADISDVRKYSVQEPNTLVLDLNGKTQQLSFALQNEQDFTSALLKLESSRTPTVCWAAGAGARSQTDPNQSSGYSSVGALLARNNFTVQDVPITQLTSIPSGCDEVALVGSSLALPPATVRALDDYLAGGGSLLIVADPWESQAVTSSLSSVLAPYGLGFSGALVVETDPSRSANATVPAVVSYGSSPITKDIQGIASFFPQTTAITLAPNPTEAVIALGSTSTSSFAIDRPRQNLARQAGDVAGPFYIMATMERSAGGVRTRIVAVGTTRFAENGTLPPNNSDANLELALGSFQWLAGQDSLISLPPKAARSLPLTLTQQDQSTIVFITAFLMPGLIVFGGIVVWWRRRVVG
jgi:gliding motility-associatede transport system auxiliary component